MTDNSNCQPLEVSGAAISSLPQLLETAELIESCRAHASSMVTLADVTCKSLSGGYQYEESEPQLHECCDLVRRVLEQTESVLTALGVVSLEECRPRAVDAGCLEQGRWLIGSAHTVRAIMMILRSVEPNDHPQILPALSDLESGMWTLVDGLQAIAVRESRA